MDPDKVKYLKFNICHGCIIVWEQKMNS